tara:strand:+ start:73 stop:516 length:444 start_codon:yes stop_codon:yes gene_type:complete
MNNKVIEIGLIENTDKKKKIEDPELSLSCYKKKIINDLEDVITLKFFDNSTNPNIKKAPKFIDIRNTFVSFYNNYIELNHYFLEKSKTNEIMKDILDELVKNVLDRTKLSEQTPYNKDDLINIKEVELLGTLITKSEKDKIDICMLE